MPLRFVFAVHNHQPVGNFGHVFESAYRDAYRPFLDLIEHYPEIPLTLHTSGPLLEWLVEHRPDYVDRLQEAGFAVSQINVPDLFNGDEAQRIGIARGTGSIFHCRKRTLATL